MIYRYNVPEVSKYSLSRFASTGHCGVMNAITLESGELAHEHEGLLWKAREGCTSTFEELITARARWMEIFHETQWNPWRTKELQPEADHAHEVIHQWTRAEPDHRMMTEAEVTAWMAEMDADFEARRADEDARQERDKARYSAERERSRYALLEREAVRLRLERDLEGHRSGTLFPAMPADRRAKSIADLEADRQRNEDEISRLASVAGDLEEVVDEHGRLPRDRRPLHRVGYDVHRRFNVEELKESVTEQRNEISAATDKKQKSSLRTQLLMTERHLEGLLAAPRVEAEEMCADCDTPLAQHLYGGDIYESRPCPRWPMYAARMERVWEILRSAAERSRPVEPEPPKPVPLAILPGNLPIAEVIERLSELQTEHPDALVRRGRANRWELWPSD